MQARFNERRLARKALLMEPPSSASGDDVSSPEPCSGRILEVESSEGEDGYRLAHAVAESALSTCDEDEEGQAEQDEVERLTSDVVSSKLIPRRQFPGGWIVQAIGTLMGSPGFATSLTGTSRWSVRLTITRTAQPGSWQC